ncbi:GNAT family N-acetyltransferase [Mesorhizobium sp. M1A.F.Ca.ET.072.01.1.1]|uniref:GNAT family N-acetyltransferase n=1 Tax=Mesorhizobium sp. M1A.F.Ca.ET.072.01.1.1 TaxID=2496753 RepID=UPI000FD3D27D|nr:GNAT family N-acetyltransferase [Mesorhizobium sp. M1A.F.Ca.ET.072.01.1.1]RUW47803.1 GNAT family N-acetyltransferase [Mesorhizobium sp. M1A.F.Ca.ET.072.01.1.1]TIV04231.1 MAG: GNAT family N-acetyltransferase [Mesorhizobium sp.]
MELVVAEQKDLDFIESWLQEEEEVYQARLSADAWSEGFERGFWCNIRVIRNSFENGELKVVRVGGKAVAFHLGEFNSPGITEVHPDFRGQGIGTVIVRLVLERANTNEACFLHVECISEKSRRFWSKFGFSPDAGSPNDLYMTLRHTLPLPRQADRMLTVSFFDEVGWYRGTPYKRVDIPCIVEDRQILLSEICHDQINGRRPGGDRHVQVQIGDRVVFEGWLGDENTKAFGFEEGNNYSMIAKRFSPPVGADLT